MNRVNYSSGAKWEPIVGYSRAVKIGDTIEVSGTVSIKDGKPHGEGDPYEQTKRILEIIKDSIESAGGKIENVVRTRTYILEASHWEAVGKAHGEMFGEIRPATSMVVIKELISPEYLVEIEATAIVED